jgi:hypothetical protein
VKTFHKITPSKKKKKKKKIVDPPLRTADGRASKSISDVYDDKTYNRINPNRPMNYHFFLRFYTYTHIRIMIIVSYTVSKTLFWPHNYTRVIDRNIFYIQQQQQQQQ